MVKHLLDLLAVPPEGATADEPVSYEDVIFDQLKEMFPLIIFACVQLANKQFLHSHVSFTTPLVDSLQFQINNLQWFLVFLR